MNLIRCLLPLSVLWLSRGVSVQRVGWLDRVVQYYKQKFVEDVQNVAAIQIQASVERAPAGFVDSDAWDYPAVQRLLALLAASDAAAPVRRTLRRALRSSRRFISREKTFKLFPSYGKGHPNEIYYDFNSGEYFESDAEVEAAGDDSVVVLHNPVEAHLPSAHISVKLLREILEARAVAARKMPSTLASTISWITKKHTSTASKKGSKVSSKTEDPSTTTEDSPTLSPTPTEKSSTTSEDPTITVEVTTTTETSADPITDI